MVAVFWAPTYFQFPLEGGVQNIMAEPPFDFSFQLKIGLRKFRPRYFDLPLTLIFIAIEEEVQNIMAARFWTLFYF